MPPARLPRPRAKQEAAAVSSIFPFPLQNTLLAMLPTCPNESPHSTLCPSLVCAPSFYLPAQPTLARLHLTCSVPCPPTYCLPRHLLSAFCSPPISPITVTFAPRITLPCIAPRPHPRPSQPSLARPPCAPIGCHCHTVQRFHSFVSCFVAVCFCKCKLPSVQQHRLTCERQQQTGPCVGLSGTQQQGAVLWGKGRLWAVSPGST